jgi:hypothetical protein
MRMAALEADIEEAWRIGHEDRRDDLLSDP